MSGHTSLRLVEAGPVHMSKGRKKKKTIYSQQPKARHTLTDHNDSMFEVVNTVY